MKKLDVTSKRRITDDWASLFPEMARYQPMWLARRVGPLVQGICLERDSSNKSYLPTVHVHNLCKPSDTLRLTLGQAIGKKGGRFPIDVMVHEQHYCRAAAELKAVSLLPTAGDWMLSAVLAAYDRYAEVNAVGSLYKGHLFEDAIFLAAWCDVGEHATVLVDEYAREMQTWPQEISAKYGGVEQWKTHIGDAIRHPQALRETAERQIEQLGLTRLPVSQLKCSGF